jgi:hypothetical protein
MGMFLNISKAVLPWPIAAILTVKILTPNPFGDVSVALPVPMRVITAYPIAFGIHGVSLCVSAEDDQKKRCY